MKFSMSEKQFFNYSPERVEVQNHLLSSSGLFRMKNTVLMRIITRIVKMSRVFFSFCIVSFFDDTLRAC